MPWQKPKAQKLHGALNDILKAIGVLNTLPR